MTAIVQYLWAITLGSCLTAAGILLVRLLFRRVLSAKAHLLSVAAVGSASHAPGAAGKSYESPKFSAGIQLCCAHSDHPSGNIPDRRSSIKCGP